MKVVNRITGENPVDMEKVIVDWVKRGKEFKMKQLLGGHLTDLKIVKDDFEFGE